MSKGLPERPAQRKLLVVLGGDDYRRLDYDGDGRKLMMNPEVHIQQFPASEQDRTLENMEREGLLRPGAVLLQSPFDGDVYTEVSEAEESFAVQKYMHFSTVCMMLGATEVCIDRIACKDEAGETDVEVGASGPVKSGGANVEHERIASLRSALSLRDQFEGGEPDVEAAENRMRQTGLTNEPNLRSLVEMAKVGTNRIKRREFCLDLTREVRKRLEIAAGLEIPAVIGGGLDVDHQSWETTEYSVDVMVHF